MTTNMNAEVKMPDRLDEMIVCRLLERQRKLQRMKEWEDPTHRRKWLVVLSSMSVAACLVWAFFVLYPTIQTEDVELMARPELSNYRAACPELVMVETLMDNGDYAGAMDECKRALRHSDTALKELRHSYTRGFIDDEEAEYEIAAESVVNHDVRWIYIYLLLKNGDRAEALKQIDICMKNEQYCDHIDDAADLRSKLKR